MVEIVGLVGVVWVGSVRACRDDPSVGGLSGVLMAVMGA